MKKLKSGNFLRHLTCILGFCCLFATVFPARADIPYMPLKFTLSTTKPSYLEGEKIGFILTIKNTDPSRTWPVLTPGGQNSGNKIVYLRMYDPAKNMFVLLEEESRHMGMMIKYLGLPGVEKLKPGQELKIPFYLNDTKNFFSENASHHTFMKPLFAGTYMFQAFYNPFGNGFNDSLYHLMRTTEDEQSATKLNFLGPELSSPCKVQITKNNKPGEIKVEWGYYISKEVAEGVYRYYLGSVADSNLVHMTHLPPGNSFAVADREYKKGKLVRTLVRYPDGNLQEYSLQKPGRCPERYFERVFHPANNKNIWAQKDTLPDGSTRSISYDEARRVIYEETTSADALTSHSKTYLYKEGKLKKVKKKTVKYTVPCGEILVIETKEEEWKN